MAANTGATITGVNGASHITDTTATTPGNSARYFIAIQALTDTILDYSEMVTANSYVDNYTWAADLTIPAGSIIYGRFEGIVLVSGTCLAYNGN